jgi:folylpolyglutamate synthase/dihydropteroate synthase
MTADERARLAEVEQEILARRPEHSIDPTLDRISALVNVLGDPQHAYPVIHVTGTNGKTSTARMTERLLRARGLRTGLFTSPHLSSIRERICIDGEPVSPEQFVGTYEEIQPILDLVDARQPARLSFFEVLTAMAFAVFADAPVDVAVIEVGMGGTWDSTNVADGAVAVVTPISIDHTRYLGDTVEQIATDKAGIIKPGAIAVIAQQPPAAAEVLLRRAVDVGATVAREGLEFGVLSRELAVGGQQIVLRGLLGDYDGLFLPLFGAYQAGNLACAVAAVEAFARAEPVGEPVDENVPLNGHAPEPGLGLGDRDPADGLTPHHLGIHDRSAVGPGAAGPGAAGPGAVGPGAVGPGAAGPGAPGRSAPDPRLPDRNGDDRNGDDRNGEDRDGEDRDGLQLGGYELGGAGQVDAELQESAYRGGDLDSAALDRIGLDRLQSAQLGGGQARRLDIALVRDAVAEMSSPGRLEVVRRSPVVIVDAAHNPAGMAATVAALKETFSFTELIAIVAISADKDVAGILDELEPVATRLVVTTNASGRAMDPDDLAETAESVFGPDRISVAERLSDAIEIGVGLADDAAARGDTGPGGLSGPVVLITGSVITAGEARMLLTRTRASRGGSDSTGNSSTGNNQSAGNSSAGNNSAGNNSAGNSSAGDLP